MIYNRHVGFDGAVPCEQLEEMVLFSIGFQLPPTCKAQNLYSYTFWRSRLVWSRARDWKSRNRQKRFKSSNLFFSATKIALGRVLFVLSREIRRHLCRRQHCRRTLRCTLRFACKHAHFAVGRISSSQTMLARVCGEKGKANMRSMVGLHLVAGDLRSKEMFVAMQRLTSSSPPLVNNTHLETKTSSYFFLTNISE